MRALISGDREAFYKNEIEQRERAGYPPFGRLASLVITANERHAAEAYGRTLANAAPKDEHVRVLGPPRRRLQWCAAGIVSGFW